MLTAKSFWGRFAAARHLVFLIIALALAASACDAFPAQAPPPFAPPSAQGLGMPPGIATHQVRRGSITGQISLRGRVVAVQEAPLFFKTDGWIKELRVSLGDQIEKGVLIAELESPGLEREFEDARYYLDIARLGLAHDNKPSTTDKVALAKEGVEQASVALDRARLGFAKLMAPPMPEDIEAAKLAVERAKNALWAAQEERDGIKGSRAPDYQGNAADARVAVAENSVRAAQLDLDKKLKGPIPEDIALAQNAVATAEANLAAARKNLEYEVAAKELRIASLEKEVAHREQLWQATSKRMEETRLVSPFAGTIVSLDGKVGDKAQPFSPIGVLADPSVLQMETHIPVGETDNIALGMPAKMALDGLEDKTFTGKVTSIAEKPTTWQGKSVHRVTIAFDVETPLPPVMRIGSDVTLKGKTKGNVLVVPREAVAQDGDHRYVQLVVEGKEKRVEVRTGLSNADWVEITSGLEEGDLISMARATNART